MATQSTADNRLIISVCIANYNGTEVIRPCIESALNQDFPGEYEILVHDDASTDDSIDIIKQYEPRIKLLCSKENVGYCKSNNKLVAAAQGEYILFLNNDATLRQNALSSLYAVAEASNSDPILSLSQFNIRNGELIDHGYYLDPFLNPIPNLDTELEDLGMVIGACLWIKRELWDDIGGFPDWFDTLAEDMYLCLYAILLGNGVKVVKHSGYDHHVGYSLGGGKVQNNRLSTTSKRRRLSERNKTYLIVLMHPLGMLLITLPLHIILLLMEGLILALLKRNPAIFHQIYLFSILELIKTLPRLISVRRSIQSRRKISSRTYLGNFKFTFWKLRLLFRHGIPTIK